MHSIQQSPHMRSRWREGGRTFRRSRQFLLVEYECHVRPEGLVELESTHARPQPWVGVVDSSRVRTLVEGRLHRGFCVALHCDALHSKAQRLRLAAVRCSPLHAPLRPGDSRIAIMTRPVGSDTCD
eukprot:61232-Prymnesium_polylepis.1